MHIESTDLICSTCGYIQTIQRKQSKRKKELHIKDLYCPACKKDTKFIELVDKDKYYNKLIRREELSEIEEHILNLLKEGKDLYEKGYTKNR